MMIHLQKGRHALVNNQQVRVDALDVLGHIEQNPKHLEAFMPQLCGATQGEDAADYYFMTDRLFIKAVVLTKRTVPWC
ncbi:hypothetical protein BWQ96_07514 [Gracilariopsis chorda]|uniref:Uncharacterized protein n=1 Tax=Gracilariopsis chorda TaxID=448386 RepID=A0A2V3IL01_9FLOR|nr:hypothetical protein BWQ96_07514 [Gracilariopsis chorda]|eukprot:PXF42762.1 hypothetical protein BWQ96_07514 [Gracilariopsis chorda]